MPYYTYRCEDDPGIDPCLGYFEAETVEELWMHIETHAADAHGEEPATWPPEERETVGALIKTV